MARRDSEVRDSLINDWTLLGPWCPLLMLFSQGSSCSLLIHGPTNTIYAKGIKCRV